MKAEFVLLDPSLTADSPANEELAARATNVAERMNPSVAAADVSDPTCHRELMFAQDWGFTRYLKGNVLDWRATSPKDIPHDPDAACSAENIPVLQDMAAEADLIIMAYGKLHKRHHGVLDRVIAAMVESGKPLQCLGLNKDGSAKHPLYLRKDTKPFDFPVARSL